MPRAIHYVGGDTAWNFHQFELGLPQSCFPLHPLAPISSMGQHQCVPGPVMCTSSPSTTKEHPCKWWVVAFCQSGSVPHLHCRWSGDQRAMEPHPGLCMELLVMSLAPVGFSHAPSLAIWNVRFVESVPTFPSSGFLIFCFFRFLGRSLAMLNAAPGSKQLC